VSVGKALKRRVEYEDVFRYATYASGGPLAFSGEFSIGLRVFLIRGLQALLAR